MVKHRKMVLNMKWSKTKYKSKEHTLLVDTKQHKEYLKGERSWGEVKTLGMGRVGRTNDFYVSYPIKGVTHSKQFPTSIKARAYLKRLSK